MAIEDRLGLLKLALFAACADPVSGVNEQSQLRRVAEVLGQHAGENLAVTLQEIRLQRLTLEQVAGALARPETKLLAYQIAVCICNADSAHSDPEHAFLERLRVALALDVRTARSFEREADAITGVPLQGDPSRAPLGSAHPVDVAALDRMIDEYALLTGALAARGEPVALLATIPLQMKTVYRIGKAYGSEPDRGHVGAFMSAIGIEPVSQYVEGCGYLILAGAFDHPPAARKPAATEASTASFAKTFALGQAVKRANADPTVAGDVMHDVYAAAYAAARVRAETCRPEIEARARQTVVNELLSLVKQ